MTKLLYNLDSYVREFDSVVVSCESVTYDKQQAYAIELEATCFFPEQGGQDCDCGIICSSDTFDAEVLRDTDLFQKVSNVLHVSIKDGIISHICKAPIAVGTKVHGAIDFGARFDQMQQHSGEHLFSGTVHRLFGYDNVGFHLSSRECTLDFNGTFTEEELQKVEQIVNQAIYENFEVHVFIPSPEELKSIDYRSKKELTGDVRIVEFPGYDICACCAPHVARTGEIGMIKLTAAEHFRGGTRLWIKCGQRALADYIRLLDDCREVSRITSTKIEDLVQTVSRLNDNLKDTRFKLNGLERCILDSLVSDRQNTSDPVIFTESASTDAVREAVNRLMSCCSGYCCIFTGSDTQGYRFIIGSKDSDCRQLITDLKQRFDIKGGGTAEMVQGTVLGSKTALYDFLQK